jgi:hypothetical protein
VGRSCTACCRRSTIRIDRVVRAYSRRRRSRAGSHGHGRWQARQFHDGRRGRCSAPGSVTTCVAGGSGLPGRASAGATWSCWLSGRPKLGGAAVGCTARAAYLPAVRALQRRGRAMCQCHMRTPWTRAGATADTGYGQVFDLVSCSAPGLVRPVSVDVNVADGVGRVVCWEGKRVRSSHLGFRLRGGARPRERAIGDARAPAALRSPRPGLFQPSAGRSTADEVSVGWGAWPRSALHVKHTV